MAPPGRRNCTQPKTTQKRHPKANADQIDHLVDYMVQHPHVATRKFIGMHGAARQQGSWLELVSELNALGKRKDLQSWKLTWRDQKAAASKAAARLRTRKGKTGNTGGRPTELTARELKILGLLGQEYVEGSSCPDAFPAEREDAVELLAAGDNHILDIVPEPVSSAVFPERNTSHTCRDSVPAPDPRAAHTETNASSASDQVLFDDDLEDVDSWLVHPTQQNVWRMSPSPEDAVTSDGSLASSRLLSMLTSFIPPSAPPESTQSESHIDDQDTSNHVNSSPRALLELHTVERVVGTQMSVNEHLHLPPFCDQSDSVDRMAVDHLEDTHFSNAGQLQDSPHGASAAHLGEERIDHPAETDSVPPSHDTEHTFRLRRDHGEVNRTALDPVVNHLSTSPNGASAERLEEEQVDDPPAVDNVPPAPPNMRTNRRPRGRGRGGTQASVGPRMGQQLAAARSAFTDIADRQVACMEMFAESTKQFASAMQTVAVAIDRIAAAEEERTAVFRMIVESHNMSIQMAEAALAHLRPK